VAEAEVVWRKRSGINPKVRSIVPSVTDCSLTDAETRKQVPLKTLSKQWLAGKSWFSSFFWQATE